MAVRKTSDGSVVDSYGRILYFSFDRFMSEIVQGNRCFICGISPDVARFNDEHALPDWILRRYELHGRKMHLPNATSCEYRHFKILAVRIATPSWVTLLRSRFGKCLAAVTPRLRRN